MSDYTLLARQLETLLDTRDWLTNAAQTCAFLKHEISDLNWAGFYLQRQPRTLILGPFQGLPACNPIAFDKGVCGAAATTRRTQRVEDVHAFPGHIACDAASRSELVVPIIHDGELWGVLDLDSPRPERFSEDDQRGIERLVEIFIAASDLSTPNVTG
ncbi:GAF domain-containing protein [Chromohalobacter nigrandesensis]|uniref:GAF domain-containing protein n=1 Tax=Chromohalobacter nigrandesensis TaxID=119863 RepID=UPI001FF18311|nr:GAF domain-containing protein [Chromohalobacter nigrandesensis]MCK0746471.1 GAF domain-containing protein [Chromohalobacter nigrandesensis]